MYRDVLPIGGRMMTDALFVLTFAVTFTALLYAGEWLLEHLLAWWDGRVQESMEPGWWERGEE